MPKFKIGDLLEIDVNARVNNANSPDRDVAAFLSGKLLKVTGFYESNLLFDGYRNDGIGYNPGRFKLASMDFMKTERADYIIVLKKDGKYLPAETPRVLTSPEQATLVAEQMSKRHGGEFFVFKSVYAVEVPPPAPVPPKKTRTFA